MLALGVFAYGQQGRPGGSPQGQPGGAPHGQPNGAGAGAGMGQGAGMGTHMGPGTEMDMGHANVHAGMSGSRMGSSSPNQVLSNAKLNTSLTTALGKSGVTIPGGNLQTACQGFKNLGGCVAAMHAAKNLNLNFADLQSRMTGKGAVSLGKAIQNLGGPAVSTKEAAKKAAKTANKQADADLNEASRLSAQSPS